MSVLLRFLLFNIEVQEIRHTCCLFKVHILTLKRLASTKTSYILQVSKYIKYELPFSGHQALKGLQKSLD